MACAGGVGWGHREYVRYSVGLGRALTRLVESARKKAKAISLFLNNPFFYHFHLRSALTLPRLPCLIHTHGPWPP